MRSHRQTLMKAGASLVALALLAAACGDDDDGGTAGTAGGPQSTAAATTAEGATTSAGGQAAGEEELCTADRVGGTLTVGTSGFTGMSPYLTPGTGLAGADYMAAFYDTLMRYDATTQEFVPNVAESLESNDDFTEWTLTLRPDVTFGNGDVLTTADVRAHFEAYATSRVRATGMTSEIEEIEVIDDLTMVFRVNAPWGMFPYVLASEPGWIPNSRLVAERGEGFHLNPQGAGVGPFEVERLAPGEEIVMRARDDYWGGPVCIETLTFRPVFSLGPEAVYQSFQAGEIDVAVLNSTVVAKEAEANGDVGYAAQTGATEYVIVDQGITGRPSTPYMDVRTREAMQLAVDYDAINERLYDGVGITTSALVPEESVLYHGMEGPPFDPDRARQLVEELKAEGVWDGHINLLVGAGPPQVEMGVLFEAMWEAVGMDVDVETTPQSYQRVTLERNFEVGTQGAAIVDPAPWSAVNTLYTNSPRSRTGYGDPDMDAALDQLRAAATIEETKAALGAMQEVWNRTFPYIVFSHAIWAIIVQDDVHGMQYGSDVTPYFGKAWIG